MATCGGKENCIRFPREEYFKGRKIAMKTTFSNLSVYLIEL